MSSGVALAAFATALVATGAVAQAAPKLSVQDYIDIRQLVNNYPAKIDRCTNGGYDYADQYTADGTFGVSSEWSSAGKIWYRGRDQLADAAGGGPGGCRPNPWGGGSAPHHHIVTSVAIAPTSTGAAAKSTLLSLGSGTAENPPKIEWQGGYEDRFVKTAKGWRFQSRLHVWPGEGWPDTAAEQQARMKAHAAQTPKQGDRP